MMPTQAGAPPSVTVRNIGINGAIISEAASLSRLTSPSRRTLKVTGGRVSHGGSGSLGSSAAHVDTPARPPIVLTGGGDLEAQGGVGVRVSGRGGRRGGPGAGA